MEENKTPGADQNPSADNKSKAPAKKQTEKKAPTDKKAPLKKAPPVKNSEADAAAEIETFEHKGKKYGIHIHALIVPGFGKLTALEIANHPEAQKALVEMQDSSIQEIV